VLDFWDEVAKDSCPQVRVGAADRRFSLHGGAVDEVGRSFR